MGHTQPVWLHGMVAAVVHRSEVACTVAAASSVPDLWWHVTRRAPVQGGGTHCHRSRRPSAYAPPCFRRSLAPVRCSSAVQAHASRASPAGRRRRHPTPSPAWDTPARVSCPTARPGTQPSPGPPSRGASSADCSAEARLPCPGHRGGGFSGLHITTQRERERLHASPDSHREAKRGTSRSLRENTPTQPGRHDQRGYLTTIVQGFWHSLLRLLRTWGSDSRSVDETGDGDSHTAGGAVSGGCHYSSSSSPSKVGTARGWRHTDTRPRSPGPLLPSQARAAGGASPPPPPPFPRTPAPPRPARAPAAPLAAPLRRPRLRPRLRSGGPGGHRPRAGLVRDRT